MSGYSATGNSGGGREIEFQKLTQTITKSIQKIIQNVSSMQRTVNQYGTAQDSPETKQQLHQIQTYTQQLIGDTENMINEIGNCKDRHLKMERDRLVDEFTSALTAFQSVQRKMIEYERNALKQARMNANNSQPIARPPGSGANKNNNSSSYGSGGPFEDNFVGMAMSQQNQVQAQMQEDMDVQALEEQERSIRELEENIVGVNEIYKKLGSLVYEQGAMVDSIEANVEQTNVFVSEGTDQLKKAHHYKNKVMKKRLYLALFLAILLTVIVLIIHWS